MLWLFHIRTELPKETGYKKSYPSRLEMMKGQEMNNQDPKWAAFFGIVFLSFAYAIWAQSIFNEEMAQLRIISIGFSFLMLCLAIFLMGLLGSGKTK